MAKIKIEMELPESQYAWTHTFEEKVSMMLDEVKDGVKTARLNGYVAASVHLEVHGGTVEWHYEYEEKS